MTSRNHMLLIYVSIPMSCFRITAKLCKLKQVYRKILESISVQVTNSADSQPKLACEQTIILKESSCWIFTFRNASTYLEKAVGLELAADVDEEKDGAASTVRVGERRTHLSTTISTSQVLLKIISKHNKEPLNVIDFSISFHTHPS